MQVKVAIAHFFKEAQANSGYGSGRLGARLERTIALSRCISSLLALRRSPADAVLQHNTRSIGQCPVHFDPNQRTSHIELDIHVWTNGDDYLEDVLMLYSDRITVHVAQLNNPKLLPIQTRNWLIEQDPIAELNVYLEDDIVITDQLFFDKQLWFLHRTNHQAVLMPHRFEPHPSGQNARLLVDGPLPMGLIGRFLTPQTSVATGRFRPEDEPIEFELSANPHAGCFVVDKEQVLHLRKQNLPSDGFVSPLETAATLTVMEHFMALKPAAGHQRFLMVEHGHPSFLTCLDTFPRD